MKYQNRKLKKRKDRNLWEYRFRKNGKEIKVYGKTQRECIKNYKIALQEKTKTTEYTLKSWYDKFMELYKIGKVTDTTMNVNNSDFSKIKNLHKRKLKDLDQFEIQNAINKIPYASIRLRVWTLLNELLEKAFINDLIKKNVMKLVEKPKYKAKEKSALTKQEENLFVDKCKNNKWGDFYLVCLYQGVRKGECRALKVNDVDFENKTLKIDESLNVHTDRTNTKNKQSNRIMPLFDKTAEILKKHIIGKKRDDFIFDIGINRIDKALRDILKDIKIRHITTHSLRHTFITRCQEAHIPLFVVQSWVGHERGSVVTTKIYTHLNDETNIKFADIINNIKN